MMSIFPNFWYSGTKKMRSRQKIYMFWHRPGRRVAVLKLDAISVILFDAIGSLPNDLLQTRIEVW